MTFLYQAAEAGNLDEFIRLYQFDNNRLTVQDGKGRTVAHQAAARNKTNILQFILEQNGGNELRVIYLIQLNSKPQEIWNFGTSNKLSNQL